MAMVELILDFVLVVNYKGRYHTTTTYSSLFSQMQSKGTRGKRGRNHLMAAKSFKSLIVVLLFLIFRY